jgi:secretion/DNA translocation related CpaE-like protein
MDGEGGAVDVVVVAHEPEPARTLVRLVRDAGGRPVVLEAAAGAAATIEAALVVAQWPVDGPTADALVGGARGVVLVCSGEPDPQVWRDAVRLRAENVVVLPEGQAWLVDRVAAAVSTARRAPVIATVGGRGGAGATTLAAALAVTAARRDLDVTLLDLDPLGGGLDLLLGAESAPGLRWQDLRNAPGRLPAGAVRRTAPQACGIRLVGWDRTEPARVSARTVAAVLECAADGAEGADVVVVDLPRHVDEAARVVLAAARRVLVVVPAEVRAAAAAARVVADLEPSAADICVVVRGPAPTGLPAAAVADMLGLPIAGELRPEPGLAAALDRGDVPPITMRGPLAALSVRLLASALSG